MTAPTWVFGYGSLIWRPDFPFLESRDAVVKGWSRRFWQGSHDHRGTPQRPGRVVTLVPIASETCQGRAFLIEPSVLAHLDYREKNGYERVDIDLVFSDREGSANEHAKAIVYIAPRDNVAYLGDAPIRDIARQIAVCTGPSGTNAEYLLELAAALRSAGVDDPHVFEIEQSVVHLIGDQKQRSGSNP